MRLIDADALLRKKGYCYDKDGHLLYAVGTGYIVNSPTIDAVPINPLSVWLAAYAAPPKYAIDEVNGAILDANDRARAWEYHWKHLMECGLMEEEPNGRDHGPVDQG